MEVKVKYVDDLIPYARNSRTHSEEQILKIASSIREFGFNNPVLIDQDGGIIAGHGRVLAARKIGINEVPTIELSHLTDTQKKAYVIADNKIALNAGWDEAMLKLELEELRLADFDIDLTGFTDEEFNLLMDEPETQKQGLTEDDSVPHVVENPITKLGDIWLLGNHRLMCFSSIESHAVELLLNGQIPNTMITDPPYGVKYEAGWRGNLKGRKPTEREKNSSIQNDDISDWYEAWVLFPGSVAYVWHASTFTDVVMDSLRRAGFEVKQQIIWNKNVHVLSRSDYHWKHEPCWYAVKPSGDRNWNGGRTQKTVWDIPSIIFEKNKTSHPTQKPVAIFETSLKNHTNSGEYVYEPFAGSGTSIIACEKLGRRSLSMELDPKYCDVIIKRWQDFTGKDAVLESTGLTLGFIYLTSQTLFVIIPS